MSLRDLAQKAGLWEGEGEEPATPPPQSRTVVVVAPSLAPDPSITNPAYDTLVAHTRFEATDAGKVFQKYYDKLTRITDEHQRRATAIDLASNDGVDAAKLTAAFDQLEAQLQGQTDIFNKAADERLQRVYTEPKARLDAITAQIDQLKQEQLALQASLQPAYDKVTTVKAQFQSAWQRRSAELKQQRSLFTGG